MGEIKYSIIKSNRKTLAIEIRSSDVLVRVPMRTTKKQIDEFVHKHQSWIEAKLAKIEKQKEISKNCSRLDADDISALYEKAKEYIPIRVHHFAQLVSVDYGKITIRCQRTRWGSCTTKGNLSFNCLLMLAPKEVIDSVVVHELCHIKQMNHSQTFYNEVLRVYPDYHTHNKWLKQNGNILMLRAFGGV